MKFLDMPKQKGTKIGIQNRLSNWVCVWWISHGLVIRFHNAHALQEVLAWLLLLHSHFGPNNLQMSWRNSLIANVKSALMCWYSGYFQPCAILQKLFANAPFVLGNCLSLDISEDRVFEDFKHEPPSEKLDEDHPGSYKNFMHQCDVTYWPHNLRNLAITWWRSSEISCCF